jgi:hypothetical protein
MAIDATGINLPNFGYRTFETITGNLTTDINDSGKVLNCTGATPTITLHAVAAGETLTIRVGANPQVLTIDPNGNDKIQGCDAAGADGKYIKFTNQPIGSFITLIGGNSDGWIISGVSGAFTAE